MVKNGIPASCNRLSAKSMAIGLFRPVRMSTSRSPPPESTIILLSFLVYEDPSY